MRLLSIIVMLFALAYPAQAQMVQMQLTVPCWPRSAVISAISGKYKEVPHAFGISQKSLVELYVSKTGSYTIMRTAPLGLTCVLDSGDGWEQLPPAKYGDPT